MSSKHMMANTGTRHTCPAVLISGTIAKRSSKHAASFSMLVVCTLSAPKHLRRVLAGFVDVERPPFSVASDTHRIGSYFTL